MFVRKRLNASKRCGLTERYQVLESYREDGKVKQRVICALGLCSTPEEALEKARRNLERQENRSPWTAWNLPGRSIKQVESREAERLRRLEAARARVAEVENVVSRMSGRRELFDTTKQKMTAVLSRIRTREGGRERVPPPELAFSRIRTRAGMPAATHRIEAGATIGKRDDTQ